MSNRSANLRRDDYGRPVLLVGLVALAFGVSVVVAVWRGEWHDYRRHSEVWSVVLDGGGPWLDSPNAYGPLFNVFAPLWAIDPLAPKLFFCTVWFALGLLLINIALDRQAGRREVWGLACLVFWNPFFWTNVAVNGQFDILVAAICIWAIHSRLQMRPIHAGILLGAAVLLKFYPLLLLLFASLDRGRIQLRMATSCLVTVALGMAMSWAIWGDSTFSPLLFAAERESKMLSIFAFLRGRFSPLHLVSSTPNVDFLGTPLFVLAVMVAFFVCYRKCVPVLFSVLAGSVCGFTLYKVGHQQFLLVVFLLVAYMLARGAMTSLPRPLIWALASYLTWLIVFDLAYCISGLSNRGFGLQQWPGVLLREFAGLPTLLLGGWLVLEILARNGETKVASN